MTDAPTPTPPARGLRTTAWIAALFSIVVGALMIANNLRDRTVSLVDASELTALKEQLANSPRDEALKTEIRQLDLTVRRNFFRRKQFSAAGAVLLIAGIVVFVLVSRLLAASRRQLPMPTGPRDEAAGEERGAAQARWSIAAAAVMLGSAALTLITGPGSGLTAAAVAALGSEDGPSSKAAPTYPSAAELAQNWPRFRGPGGLGRAPSAELPTSWDGAKGEGIRWKTAIPAPGKNSPVIWGNRLFITGATEDKREVFCYDLESGELVWRKSVFTIAGTRAEPPEVMEDTGYAAPTAVADGQRVTVMFANGDIAAFNFSGKQLWATNLGVPDNVYGHAASLVQWQDVILVQFDQAGEEDGLSAMLALDAASGDTLWDVSRPVANSWATPILIAPDGGEQLITAGAPWVISYDPVSGTELWRANCLSGDVGASPVFGAGMVLVGSTYAKGAAISPDGEEDVTESHIAWTVEEGLPDTCSPVTDGERLYFIDAGYLWAYAVADGKKLFDHSLGADFTASPSLVGDQVWLLSNDGVMIMVKAADAYQEVGRAELGEACFASPAFHGNRIYIRGDKHLYCIGE